MAGKTTGDGAGIGDEVIVARLAPSVPRRWFGVGLLVALGAMLSWIAFWHPPAAFALRLFLLVLAGGAFAVAVSMWQATARAILLTGQALREEGGEVLARLDEIEEVSRGALAFKPSQGFVLRLRASKGRRWRPGLWWRFGRSLGVGGVTPRNEGRFMAERLAERVAAQAGTGRIGG